MWTKKKKNLSYTDVYCLNYKNMMNIYNKICWKLSLSQRLLYGGDFADQRVFGTCGNMRVASRG